MNGNCCFANNHVKTTGSLELLQRSWRCLLPRSTLFAHNSAFGIWNIYKIRTTQSDVFYYAGNSLNTVKSLSRSRWEGRGSLNRPPQTYHSQINRCQCYHRCTFTMCFFPLDIQQKVLNKQIFLFNMLPLFFVKIQFKNVNDLLDYIF